MSDNPLVTKPENPVSVNLEAVDGILERARFYREAGGFEIPTEHIFAKGLGVRMIVSPPGSTLISYVHKKENVALILKGSVTIYEGDDRITEMAAPQVFVTKPGTLRMVLCHDEVIWVTVHPTECDNRADFEAEVFGTAWTPDDYVRIAAELGVPVPALN